MANLTFERRSLAENTVEELLQMADEFDAMATRASTQDARRALERLGARFRIFAAGRAALQRGETPVRPGEPAPDDGVYELRNIFGRRAGTVVQGRKGQLLPRAASGLRWHLTPEYPRLVDRAQPRQAIRADTERSRGAH